MGATFKVDVKVQGTANQYQWYVEERFLPNQNQPTLQIDRIPLEAENLYQCRVTTPIIPGLLLFSLPDTLIVKNTAPESISLSSQVLRSNLALGMPIATLKTQDRNRGDKHTYTLSGSDASYFEIKNNELVAGPYRFDFENKLNYNLKITSTDKGGLSVSQNFVLRYVPTSDDGDSISLNIEEDPASPPEETESFDTDLEVINLNTILPYPNPTEGLIKFKGLPSGAECKMQIINQVGQIVRQYTRAQAVYDLSDLAKGLYLVHITVGSKTKILKILLH